jgi:hypothetical protein
MGETYAPTCSPIKRSCTASSLVGCIQVMSAGPTSTSTVKYISSCPLSMDLTPRVARLNKSLYGLKQAGQSDRNHNHLRASLERFGYTVTGHDKCCSASWRLMAALRLSRSMVMIYWSPLLTARTLLHSSSTFAPIHYWLTQTAAPHLGLLGNRTTAGSVGRETQPGLLKVCSILRLN